MTRRSGLGRGLDALLPPEGVRAVESAGRLTEIPLGSIEPNPRQPRKSFDDGSIAELAASIAELGVLQPLLVRRRGAGSFELVAGERRLRAARMAGLGGVPALVVDTDDRGSLERALVENLHREDLNPIEEAAAYKQLVEEGGLTQEALAQRLGRSRVTITHSLRLLELPTAIQGLLVQGRISAAHGKALQALHGSPFQERLARRAAQEGLSVRETEDLVRRYQSMSGAAGTVETTPARPAVASDAQRALSDWLQARVRVEVRKRKGRIVVDFVSLEDLDRVVGVMLGQAEGSSSSTVAPR